MPNSDPITIGKKHPTLHWYFICNTCVYYIDDVKTLSITDSLINLCDWTSSWTFSRRIVFLIKNEIEISTSDKGDQGWRQKGWGHKWWRHWWWKRDEWNIEDSSEINHFVTSWLFLLIHWCKPSMVAQLSWQICHSLTGYDKVRYYESYDMTSQFDQM